MVSSTQLSRVPDDNASADQVIMTNQGAAVKAPENNKIPAKKVPSERMLALMKKFEPTTEETPKLDNVVTSGKESLSAEPKETAEKVDNAKTSVIPNPRPSNVESKDRESASMPGDSNQPKALSSDQTGKAEHVDVEETPTSQESTPQIPENSEPSISETVPPLNSETTEKEKTPITLLNVEGFAGKNVSSSEFAKRFKTDPAFTNALKELRQEGKSEKEIDEKLTDLIKNSLIKIGDKGYDSQKKGLGKAQSILMEIKNSSHKSSADYRKLILENFPKNTPLTAAEKKEIIREILIQDNYISQRGLEKKINLILANSNHMESQISATIDHQANASSPNKSLQEATTQLRFDIENDLRAKGNKESIKKIENESAQNLHNTLKINKKNIEIQLKEENITPELKDQLIKKLKITQEMIFLNKPLLKKSSPEYIKNSAINLENFYKEHAIPSTKQNEDIKRMIEILKTDIFNKKLENNALKNLDESFLILIINGATKKEYKKLGNNDNEIFLKNMKQIFNTVDRLEFRSSHQEANLYEKDFVAKKEIINSNLNRNQKFEITTERFLLFNQGEGSIFSVADLKNKEMIEHDNNLTIDRKLPTAIEGVQLSFKDENLSKEFANIYYKHIHNKKNMYESKDKTINKYIKNIKTAADNYNKEDQQEGTSGDFITIGKSRYNIQSSNLASTSPKQASSAATSSTVTQLDPQKAGVDLTKPKKTPLAKTTSASKPVSKEEKISIPKPAAAPQQNALKAAQPSIEPSISSTSTPTLPSFNLPKNPLPKTKRELTEEELFDIKWEMGQL